MLAIKRWIIVAVAGVAVLAAALAILLATCLGKEDNDTVSSGASSQYTESELEEIRGWWNSGAAVVEE